MELKFAHAIMQKSCSHCRQSFLISAEDLKFYEKVSPLIAGKQYLVPPPTLCPQCRQQRRLTWRNERHLYHRKCDRTGKQIISIYAPEKPYTVYSQEEWWSDRWDPLSYGQEFDFSRPFFEQFHELQLKVPRVALYQKNVENSAYTNHTEKLKNCYICVDVADSENIYYSKWIVGNCRDICDSYQMERSELCYESLYGLQNYHCIATFFSENCRDSAFLYDCIGCQDCLMCWNLQQKKHCVLNMEYSKEEYERILGAAKLHSFSHFEKARQEFLKTLEQKAIHKAERFLQCESCSGDFLSHCKNVHDSYDVMASQDLRYCYDSGHLQDCYDTYEAAFDCMLQYDTHACNRGKRTLFSHASYDVDQVCYADSCHNSSNLFGCIGLRQKHYCILNKQYSKEEYEKLNPKIIEHMMKSGEWGEFFPTALSPFAYNETVAQEYFPLSPAQVTANGWNWYEEKNAEQYLGPKVEIPDDIHDIPENFSEQILLCKTTNRPYKVIPQELEFYKKMNLPIPRKCPEERHRERLALRTPRKQWQRQCTQCQKIIHTSYAPDRPEKIYCEVCYLATVH